MGLEEAEGMANSVDPDQTDQSDLVVSLIWACFVCRIFTKLDIRGIIVSCFYSFS